MGQSCKITCTLKGQGGPFYVVRYCSTTDQRFKNNSFKLSAGDHVATWDGDDTYTKWKVSGEVYQRKHCKNSRGKVVAVGTNFSAEATVDRKDLYKVFTANQLYISGADLDHLDRVSRRLDRVLQHEKTQRANMKAFVDKQQWTCFKENRPKEAAFKSILRKCEELGMQRGEFQRHWTDLGYKLPPQ